MNGADVNGADVNGAKTWQDIVSHCVKTLCIDHVRAMKSRNKLRILLGVVLSQLVRVCVCVCVCVFV